MNQPPGRNTSGYTSDPPWGPLANSGFGNPFFYHQFADDFDQALGSSTNGLYTITNTGAGTVAHTPGDGGLALFTTAATANALDAIQLPAASFTLPGTGSTPPGSSTSQKKLFYLCRLQMSDVTLGTFIAGLCNTTTTLFTTGVQSVTDGLFFYKAPGAANNLVVLNIASAGQSPSGVGFTNTFTIPTTAYTLANNTAVDLAYYIDRNQNLFIFVGAQLVGWIPQSGTGTVNAAGVPTLPVLGPVFANYNFNAQGVQTPVMFTQANLNLSLALSNGVTAAVKTMTADFHCVQKER
jgi:hypothetical protein